jgi:hypothetical protein
MKSLKQLTVIGLLFSTAVSANSVGLSTHPLTMKKQVFGTEFNNYLNNGRGMGLTARYLNRLSEDVNMDAGIGVTDGDRASRFFVGSDIQILPDWDNQPRVSTKVMMETADEFDERHHRFGVAPTVSKGFSMSGEEVFPFVAIPVMIDLNAEDETYRTNTNLAVGMTGRIPFEGYENLIGNIEANVGLNQTYTSLVLGVSLPIQ